MNRIAPLGLLFLLATPILAQEGPPAPEIKFESVPFLKLNYERNLGEVLGVAMNSKGHLVVLNHPGTGDLGAPVYGEATTQLLEFDEKGNFVRQLGKGVYGLAYAHSVRFDKYDNLWVVDKATMSVMKFNPEGMVVMNLGRRDEGPDEPRYRHANPPPVPVDAMFNGTTDVIWDADDNIYISDGYFNSEIAKFDKHGNWIKRWGSAGKGGEHANERSGAVQQSPQYWHRPPGQHLRGRPWEPAYSGFRYGRQLQAVYLPECALRQIAPSGAGQPESASS